MLPMDLVPIVLSGSQNGRIRTIDQNPSSTFIITASENGFWGLWDLSTRSLVQVMDSGSTSLYLHVGALMVRCLLLGRQMAQFILGLMMAFKKPSL